MHSLVAHCIQSVKIQLPERNRHQVAKHGSKHIKQIIAANKPVHNVSLSEVLISCTEGQNRWVAAKAAQSTGWGAACGINSSNPRKAAQSTTNGADQSTTEARYPEPVVRRGKARLVGGKRRL
jgi:hypothetical protein